jgi:hypothetical protein
LKGPEKSTEKTNADEETDANEKKESVHVYAYAGVYRYGKTGLLDEKSK